MHLVTVVLRETPRGRSIPAIPKFPCVGALFPAFEAVGD